MINLLSAPSRKLSGCIQRRLYPYIDINFSSQSEVCEKSHLCFSKYMNLVFILSPYEANLAVNSGLVLLRFISILLLDHRNLPGETAWIPETRLLPQPRSSGLITSLLPSLKQNHDSDHPRPSVSVLLETQHITSQSLSHHSLAPSPQDLISSADKSFQEKKSKKSPSFHRLLLSTPLHVPLETMEHRTCYEQGWGRERR